jgi:hypothetical protein
MRSQQALECRLAERAMIQFINEVSNWHLGHRLDPFGNPRLGYLKCAIPPSILLNRRHR